MLHALELLPDEAGEAAVRRDWQALRDAGLPSQLDHAGASNAPHLTLVAAPTVAAAAELAVPLLSGVLPAPVRAAGLLVLGGSRLTIARAVDVPDALVSAVLELRAVTGDLAHSGWLPHVTLARRVERADLQRAVDAVGHADVVLTMATLRRWDPDSRSIELLLTVRP
jgi:hypothetical protein